MSKIKRLFWDIETSPNVMFSWGCGWKVRLTPENIIEERQIICICYKWEGEKKVHSLAWDDVKGDRAMVKQFSKIMLQADELVAHNGDKFDLRWFNGRCLVNKAEAIPPDIKTVDTLVIARKRFYLNSNRLDYLAKMLFGEGKIHTDYDLWKRCHPATNPSAAGRARAVNRMVAYCKKDVALLEKVYHEVAPYHAPKSHAAVLLSGNSADKWKCPRCASDHVYNSKTRTTARGTIQRQMQCKDCRGYYTIAETVHKNYLKAQRLARLRKR